MDCDSLTSLLLSTSFISWSKEWIRVEDVSSVISANVFRSVDRRVSLKDCCTCGPDNDCCVSLTDCCASGTDYDWIWFCIITLWLCETAMLLMSMLNIAVSLGHGGILNLSLNYWFAPVESYISATESGCACILVYRLFEAAMFSMSILGKFSIWCWETTWSILLDSQYSILICLFQIWDDAMSQFGMLSYLT